jgi:hypothetical protein
MPACLFILDTKPQGGTPIDGAGRGVGTWQPHIHVLGRKVPFVVV